MKWRRRPLRNSYQEKTMNKILITMSKTVDFFCRTFGLRNEKPPLDSGLRFLRSVRFRSRIRFHHQIGKLRQRGGLHAQQVELAQLHIFCAGIEGNRFFNQLPNFWKSSKSQSLAKGNLELFPQPIKIKRLKIWFWEITSSLSRFCN